MANRISRISPDCPSQSVNICSLDTCKRQLVCFWLHVYDVSEPTVHKMHIDKLVIAPVMFIRDYGIGDEIMVESVGVFVYSMLVLSTSRAKCNLLKA